MVDSGSPHAEHRSRHLMPGAVVVCSVLIACVAYLTLWVQASARGRVDGYVPTLPAGAATVPAAQAPSPVSSMISSTGVRLASPTWANRMSRRTGIPAVALQAYASAELNAPPDCHLGWTTLAGIGWIESGHGTHGGSIVDASGRTSAAIDGPQLDGGLGHAMGPMQFIADTWDRWASDGDGNGTADISNVFDAAYTAARYLCAGSRDLSRGVDWAQAIFSYNHAQWYVDQVYGAATTYAARAR